MGFPLLREVSDHYADNDDIVFIAVQTVFEGFATNTMEKGIKIVTDTFGLDIPVGLSGSPNHRSALMQNYHSRGTPWVIIIGPDGVVQHNDFHLETQAAIELIDSLQPDADDAE